jgi:hypothetical protein
MRNEIDRAYIYQSVALCLRRISSSLRALDLSPQNRTVSPPRRSPLVRKMRCPYPVPSFRQLLRAIVLWATRIAIREFKRGACPVWRPVGNSFCHYATTSAFAAAQAFHKSAERSIGVEAEAAKRVSGQARLMPTLQATDY